MLARAFSSPTVVTWVSFLIKLSGAAVILPLVLKVFQPPEVLLWQMFSSIYIIVMMLDLGLAPTFIRLLSYARAGLDIEEMRQVSASSPRSTGKADALQELFACLVWLMLILSIVALLVAAVAGTFVLHKPVAGASHPDEAWTAWAVVLVASAISFFGSAYSSGLQGMDKVLELRRWEVITGLLQVASSIVALLLGADLLVLTVVYNFWLVANVLRNRMLLRHTAPEVFSGRPRLSSRVVAVMWPAAWRSGLGVLMSQGIFQASGLLYAQLGSARQAAEYLLALRFVSIVSQFSQAPFYSRIPVLAELHGRGRKQELLDLAARSMKMSHWTFITGALAVGLLGKPLLDWWSPGVNMVDERVWFLMCTGFLLERFGAMHLQLYSLSNKIIWHYANGITGAIMIGACYVLLPRLGVAAFPVSMIMAYAAFYVPCSVWHSVKEFGIRLLPFEARVSIPPALAFGAFALISIVIVQIQQP